MKASQLTNNSSNPSMSSFYTEAELASDTYRMLGDEKSLRAFIVVAASILGDFCDIVIPLEEIEELNNPEIYDYESLCDSIAEHPIKHGLKEYWLYYWDSAAFIFNFYKLLPNYDDWNLYLEIVDPLNPGWDSEVSDKEQHLRDQITETCFAIKRWVMPFAARKQLV